jgi:DnaJ-domain-containing protein 1
MKFLTIFFFLSAGFIFGKYIGLLLGLYFAISIIKAWRKEKVFVGSIAHPTEDPYGILGVKRGDSYETVKRAYRAIAKKNHPDLLRAEGKSEREIKAATVKMSRINEAWRQISEEMHQ